jgi:PAS domain S-box-containing protein
MKTWVDSCPENFLHLYLLVAAEMARTSGDWSAAADLYDEALASASEFGFIQNEALANELAGKFWLGRGKKKIAGLYMAEALYAYHLWGAEHKAADLEAKVPFVSAKSGGSASTSTSSGIGQSLDVMAVVKAAQVISGEIRLKNLVEKVMDIVMKNAGAENGALILKKDKSLIVEARVFEEDPRKTFFTSVSLGECDSLSLSIIRYVARTRENVVLHDAAADAMFGQDPHILKTRPRSILSIPILRHRELSGILYLENNKMVGAFTPERVEVLQLLAAQAAISIENAKLYTTYRSLYDNAIEGMFQSTPLGRYLTCNPAMARILGYDSPEDLIESMTDIRQQLYYNPNDRYRFTDMLDRDGRAIGFETRFLRKDGTPIWVSESARKVCDSLGNVLYYEGTVLDITARKEKEESERQREIAVRSTQAKSEFLANMSHEIRTPMNAIIGLAYLAQKTELTLKQKDYVVKIENAAQSLLGIINDILDFSKIEAGKLDLETIGFDLAEVLEQLSSLISPKAAEKEVELLFDIAPDVPYALEGDPVRLGQILINLVNNAIKFTEAGQILVKAEAMEPLNESEDSRVSLKFSVKDTGIGMTEEQMAGLFRPFFQADGSSTRKYGGTGLGLTICKQLVEMMDGEIWVESEPGEGSVFSFFVRLGKQTSAAARSLAPPGLAGRRVLVVDDNPTSREIVAAILVSFSLDVMQASSVKEAFSELRAADPAFPIELVFMDYKMPEMNGVEAIKYIRNELLLTHQPAIVMLTAYGSEDVMEKARLINIDGYLVKPVHPSLLFDTVMDTLDGRISREISEFKATDMDAQSLKQVSGAKVLLVEDNAINQQVASEILAQFGLQVSIANNGLEALKAFELSAFDLVLMDIQMPALDGYRASKAIRTMEKTRGGATDRIPIVAMTAHAMAGEREKCLDAGMDDHIAKPIDPALLFDKIVHWIAPDRIKAGQAAPKRGNVDAFEFPPHLPGIDLEAGISRLMGNTAVYRALLLNFKEKYSTIDDDIATSVGKGDFIKARQLIHLVRGVAGNLGADALYRAASDFEAAAVKGDTDNAAPLISDFREKLGQVLHSINSIDIKPKVKADASVPTAHEELDLKAVETALKACDDLLTSDFLEAMSRVEALNRLLQHTAVRETVRQLEAQMGEFNINGARESLREIARNLNISLEDP